MLWVGFAAGLLPETRLKRDRGKIMKLPNVISAGLLATLLFFLQWALQNIGQFSIPPQYVTIVTGLLGVAITAVAKLVQESSTNPAPTATARGEVQPAHSVFHRVFLG